MTISEKQPPLLSGESIEAQVVRLLLRRSWHIAFAESCTGGLAAARLVNVPDASRVLEVSFVTYANEAKSACLGIAPALIQAHGAVSEAVAAEMAVGVCRAAKSEVGVGISGIAGPSGGLPGKPVGTVCFGFCINGETESCTRHFDDLARNDVRAAAVAFAYTHLLARLR